MNVTKTQISGSPWKSEKDIFLGFRVLDKISYGIQGFQGPLDSFQGFQGLLDTLPRKLLQEIETKCKSR